MKAMQKRASSEARGHTGPALAQASVPSARPLAAADEPSFEEIARRAHEIYLARGDGDGCADDDWLRAEEELRRAMTSGH
jgi:hypothetical protein